MFQLKIFNINRLLTLTAVSTALSLVASGCFSPYQGKAGKRGGAFASRDSSSAPIVEDAPSFGPPPRPVLGSPTANLRGGVSTGDWTFMGPQVLESVIRKDLKVESSTSNPEAQQVLDFMSQHATELGRSNYAMGVSQNLGAEPMKFRVLVELSAQACYVGMQNADVRQRFFPAVTDPASWNENSFEMIFVQLLGRSPMPEEKAVLLRAVRDIATDVTPPTLKQLAAACAVVLSSLEFAHGR